MMVLVDIGYALYTRRTAQGKPLGASTASAVIMLGSGYVVTSYVGNPILLSAAVCGAFVGTWLTIKFDKA